MAWRRPRLGLCPRFSNRILESLSSSFLFSSFLSSALEADGRRRAGEGEKRNPVIWGRERIGGRGSLYQGKSQNGWEIVSLQIIKLTHARYSSIVYILWCYDVVYIVKFVVSKYSRENVWRAHTPGNDFASNVSVAWERRGRYLQGGFQYFCGTILYLLLCQTENEYDTLRRCSIIGSGGGDKIIVKKWI